MDSSSELKRFLWKRVEENELVNGLFKHKGDVYVWAMHSEGSNKLMNKKSEFRGTCSCNARFLRLYLKRVGSADKASCGCRKLSCETCAARLKSSTKKRRGRPKLYPNKVHTGPKGSKRLLFSPRKAFGEWPTNY